jgi:DNA-binding HxlR family transcriptional regulator
MTESVETKLARIEEKQDMILRRLENGDANFKEFEKRISTLERQFYAAALVGSLLWAVFVIWFRGQVGG